MLGGRGCGKFYISEVKRVEEWHTSNIAPGGYTAEQIEAGYEALAKKFGFYHTLLYLEKTTGHKRAELLEWSVAEFKHNLRYLSWQAYTNEKYDEIMRKKK